MVGELYAQGGGQTSSVVSFLPFIFIFLIFYFLLIRPNSKKQKILEKKRNSMKKGDKVIISGGIYAKVSQVNDKKGVVVVEISPQVKVEVLRVAIADVVVEEQKISKRTEAGSKK